VDSAWQKADVWVADMPVCHRCILTICERYLGGELKSSKRDLVRSLCALVAVVLLILVAETGIFKGLGSLNLFIAIFFTGVFLYGFFGLPYYSYRSIKMFAQRASSRSGNPLKGDALLAAIQLEAARLLPAGQLKPAQSEGQAAVSSLPQGHLHRGRPFWLRRPTMTPWPRGRPTRGGHGCSAGCRPQFPENS
jgi:hypothetical protein